MRVYLDNCCFNRPFDDQSQMKVKLEAEAKLYIQDLIKKKGIELAWSYILDFENNFNPFQERKIVISSWRKLSVIDCEENEIIITAALNYQGYGLKSKDALHLACAVFMQCNYFITTDKNLIRSSKNISGILVINPVQFIEIMEEQND